MLVIPAIDLIDGRCVRLTQGRYEDETLYGDDPAVFAQRWQAEGAEYLHVVDLDGARTGASSAENLRALHRIREAVDLPIQVGGGIRNAEAVERMLGIGIDRCILGTSAALDFGLAQALFQKFGRQVVVGIDASDGKVAIKGWKEILPLEAHIFAQQMESAGAQRIIFTDISRDGMLQGVNIAALCAMLDAVQIPVIASGGVSGIEDIDALARLRHPRLEGVITGKALYVGTLSLPDAVASAKQGADYGG